jgi:anthranilate synthase component 1
VGSHSFWLVVRLWVFLLLVFAVCGFPDSLELRSFAGGAIGYMGFDCAGWFEPKLASNSPIGSTDALFMFYRNVVAFDHAKQEISIISLIFVDEANGDHAELEKKYHNAIQHNNAIKRTLENGSFSLPAAPAGRRETPVSNWEREHFENAVRTIKDLINAGECYQVVLSQCFTRPTDASAVAIYRSLRRLNPSPYMFLLEFDGTAVVGASPEMLVRCRGPPAEYRPIAGTRPRGKTPDEDAALAEEMRSDVKETAEHQMLVDLGRNDLGRVARYGTVLVARSMAVEKYSHVQHLVSQLSAELRPGTTRFDALAACFPAGTVSGAPKVRAVQIIKELEPTPRGI